MTETRGGAPSTARVVLLVTRLSLRRLYSRLSHFWRRRASKQRQAVARKGGGGKLFLAFVGVTFVFQTVVVSTSLVMRTARDAERRANAGRVLVREDTLRFVRWAEGLRAEMQGDAERVFRHSLSEAFESEAREIVDANERGERVHALWEAFDSEGAAGFRASRLSPSFLPQVGLWYRGSDPLGMLGPLGIVATLLGISVALQHVAASERDLAVVDSGLEWLFTFPVPARALFLARLVAGACADPVVWVLVLPFYAVLYWCAGYGWLGVPLGAASALYVGLVAGALRVATETVLRRALSLRNVARVQAVLLTLSYVLMAGTAALAYATHFHWLGRLTALVPRAGFVLNPWLAPLWITEHGRVALLGALAAVGIGGASALGAVWLAEQMVRHGLTSGSGPYSGQRGQKRAAPRAYPSLLRGMAQKELLGILRDRQLRTQTLVTPVLLLGLQLVLNPHLVSGIVGNPRHVATAAFATAMLVLSTGGVSSLAMEGPALWMLFTAPQPLERLLLGKLGVWISLPSAFALGVLALVGWSQPELVLPALPYFALALAGIGIYAMIALGIGALGSDPLEGEARRRVRVGSVYLFMILASLFGYALYAPALWPKLVQLVLSCLLGFALWQKVRDHLPYLLDPTEAPPPSIAVADGIMAALGFFVMQGLIQLVLADHDVRPGRALLYAFVGAGLGVTVVTLLIYYKNGVPELLRAVGLRPPAEFGARAAAGAVLLGVCAGAAAAAFGQLYLTLLEHSRWLSGLRDDSFRERGAFGDSLGAIALLAVFAAPLFEEFIFRGVLFGGLRRSLGVRAAAFGSALVFALVHPAIAALPVFILALLAAFGYARSRWLITPILAHMTYNAVVVGRALFAQP